jgi:hypothetical protein
LTHLNLGWHFAELAKKGETENQNSAILHLGRAIEIAQPFAERVLVAGGDLTPGPHLAVAFDIHAQAQSSLGSVYRQLTSGPSIENLQAALECFHSGLRLFHEAQHTQPRPNLMAKLGMAWREIFRLSDAELRAGGWERDQARCESRRWLSESIALNERLGENSDAYRELLQSWDEEDGTANG